MPTWLTSPPVAISARQNKADVARSFAPVAAALIKDRQRALGFKRRKTSFPAGCAIELLFQTLPAVDIIVLQRRLFPGEFGQMLGEARFEHE